MPFVRLLLNSPGFLELESSLAQELKHKECDYFFNCAGELSLAKASA